MECIVHQAPPSVEFSKQEYWSGLPFPSSGNLPDPGIEPMSPALQAGSLLPEPPGKPRIIEELWKQEGAPEAGPCSQAGEEGRSVCSKGSSICRRHDEFGTESGQCGWSCQEASWAMRGLRRGADRRGLRGPKSSKQPKAGLRNKSRSLGRQNAFYSFWTPELRVKALVKSSAAAWSPCMSSSAWMRACSTVSDSSQAFGP